MKRIIWGDYIDAYLKRNDEKTIISQEIEAAEEEGILSERELEKVEEKMLDNIYQKQYEEKKREYGYKFIAEHIWNAAHEALEKGNLAESIAIGEVYDQWIDVCIKAGVM